jgi:phosphodiesterase/alkaline phosphatase D-like protein
MRTLVAIVIYVFVRSVGAQEFAWFSCEHRPDPLTIADAIQALGPDLVITQGDAPYTNRAWEAWGVATEPVQFDSIASGPNLIDFNHHYDQMMSNPGWQQLMAGPYDIYSQFDDHEWGATGPMIWLL